MTGFSRRSVFGLLGGVGGVALGARSLTAAPLAKGAVDPKAAFARMCAVLREDVDAETYRNWFTTLDFEEYDGETLTVSVPVYFLMRWLSAHYTGDLRAAARCAFPVVKRVNVVEREPRFGAYRGAA